MSELSRRIRRDGQHSLFRGPVTAPDATPWLAGNADTPEDQRQINTALQVESGALYHPSDIQRLELRTLRGEFHPTHWTAPTALAEIVEYEHQKQIKASPWLTGIMGGRKTEFMQKGDWSAQLLEDGLLNAIQSQLLRDLQLTPWQRGRDLLRDLRRCERFPGRGDLMTEIMGLMGRQTPKFWRWTGQHGPHQVTKQIGIWQINRRAVILRQTLRYRPGAGFEPKLNAQHQISLTLRNT